MNEIEISQIKADTTFEAKVFIDENFLVSVPPCSLHQNLLSLMVKWGFKTLKTEAALPKSADDVAETAKKEEKPSVPKKTISMDATESVDLSEFDDAPAAPPAEKKEIPEKFKVSEEVDLESFTGPSQTNANPVSAPNAQKNISTVTSSRSSSLSDYLKNHKASATPSPSSKLSETQENEIEVRVKSRYDEFMNYVNQIYTHYATHKEFKVQEINGKILELCNFVRENKSFVLKIAPTHEERNKNFLISHSLRSTIYAIVIGQQLKMPYDKLVELGVACILHEIGQIRLPPQLYMNNRPLSSNEKAQMQTHTILGFNIVKDCGFSKMIQLGVLDHHERDNGTGYPRRLTGDKISLYAKIIGVACSFEAITTPREFKDARTTFEGMVEMLKNSSHLYDDVIVKALLHSLSLFPIGAFVYLSNNKLAQVVDVAPNSPKYPIVKIVGEKNPDGSVMTMQTDEFNLKIVRVLNKKEVDDLNAAIRAKMAKAKAAKSDGK